MPGQKSTRIFRDCGAQSGSSRSAIVGDDGELAALFIRMRSLASGRAVRRDVPPDQLTEEQTIPSICADRHPDSSVRTHQPRHHRLWTAISPSRTLYLQDAARRPANCGTLALDRNGRQ
jgi:hypothetical protein